AGEGGGGAVLGGHQRQAQHLAAGEAGTHGQARRGALEVIDVALVDDQLLAHGQVGVEHHHGGHQFGDGGDGFHRVGVLFVEGLAAQGIHHDDAVGFEPQVVAGGHGIATPLDGGLAGHLGRRRDAQGLAGGDGGAGGEVVVAGEGGDGNSVAAGDGGEGLAPADRVGSGGGHGGRGTGGGAAAGHLQGLAGHQHMAAQLVALAQGL